MDPLLRLIIIVVQSYLIGAIPFALIIGKQWYGVDVRTVGSGNLGSTNVYRNLGWKAGVAVQILDIAKGLVPVLLVASFFDSQMPFVNRTPFEDQTVVRLIAGVSAVLGHMFSVFAGMRGGKGINTSLGMLLAIAPVELAIATGFFALTVGFFGYISLGSMIAAVVIPIAMAVRYNVFHVDILGYKTIVFFMIALALLVIYAHRSNLKRLLAGTENRFAKLQVFRRGPKS
ncbi:MAG: Glycerol-3-phosphate acyltransferase [Bacteroidota bacterium]